MSRRIAINLVVFGGVFVLMLWWAVNNIVTFDFLERPYEIHGRFEQSVGLSADSEVTYLGVHYGRVASVERDPDRGDIFVTMKIDRGKRIPAGASAHVFRKSAVGEPYIDFAPPDDVDAAITDHIEPGTVVEDTTTPLEFSELLRSASALLSGIEPEAAGSLVHELAAALDGRSESLRDITTSIDRLAGRFVERTEQLDRLAANSTRVTRAVAEHRGSVSRSLTSLREVAETLRDAEGDIQAVLRDTPDFLGITADLVADQKANLDCLLTDLERVVRTAGSPDQRANLERLLRVGPSGFAYAAAAVEHEPDGPWLRVNLLLTLDHPAGQADPVLTLPAVPVIPACDSSLTSGSGAPFDPASLIGDGSLPGRRGSLPATGARPWAALGLVLAAGAVAGLAARRRATTSAAGTSTPS